MLIPLLMNLGMFGGGAAPEAPTVPPTGAARYVKRKRKKGGVVIRRSDFEALEEYEAALRAALATPMADIELRGNVVEEDDEEEELILAAITKLVMH